MKLKKSDLIAKITITLVNTIRLRCFCIYFYWTCVLALYLWFASVAANI